MISPNLPLIDLHRHLDGSVRLETILELGQQHDLPLPADDLEDLRPYVQVVKPQPGVMAFIEKFEWMVGVLVDQEACQRIAYENILDANAEGIHYIELRFSPLFMAQPHQLAPAAVIEAIIDGLHQGVEETGIRANLIGILSRHYGPRMAMQELDALLSQRDHLIALDLAGDEANFSASYLWIISRSRAIMAGRSPSTLAKESALRVFGKPLMASVLSALVTPPAFSKILPSLMNY